MSDIKSKCPICNGIYLEQFLKHPESQGRSVRYKFEVSGYRSKCPVLSQLSEMCSDMSGTVFEVFGMSGTKFPV